ncbi:MAG TPA: cyclic nucleotide-binding domain-containing protein [Desulfarculaceae bacterium]|nr:cyclic nucleotide-binding domain-containing protein [Desulfarculaceae bacterium]
MAEAETVGRVDFDWQKSSLFRFCEASDWVVFSKSVLFSEKPSGSVIWSEGERSAQLICVVSGSLEAVKKTPDWGKPIIMARYLAGASVGELVFDDAEEHSTSLQVVEKASLLLLDQDRAESLQRDSPVTAARIIRGAAYLQLERLRRADQRLATLF